MLQQWLQKGKERHELVEEEVSKSGFAFIFHGADKGQKCKLNHYDLGYIKNWHEWRVHNEWEIKSMHSHMLHKLLGMAEEECKGNGLACL